MHASHNKTFLMNKDLKQCEALKGDKHSPSIQRQASGQMVTTAVYHQRYAVSS